MIRPPDSCAFNGEDLHGLEAYSIAQIRKVHRKAQPSRAMDDGGSLVARIHLMPRALTLMAVERYLARAREDLDRLNKIQSSLAQVPVKLIDQESNFLNDQWPLDEILKGWRKGDPLPEDFFYQSCEHWRKKVAEQIKYTQDYISKASNWCDLVKRRGRRCALPKKKQRELGMLPPAPTH